MIIHIRFRENLTGSSPVSSRLLNELRSRMEMCEWRKRNREARPTEDPDSWDWEMLEMLDQEFEVMK